MFTRNKVSLIKFFLAFFVFFIINLHNHCVANVKEESGVIKSLADLAEKEVQDLKAVKDTIVKGQQNVDSLVNENMATQIFKLNKSLTDATEDIRTATTKYEGSYSKEAAKQLLNKMAQVYQNIVNDFDIIEVGFLKKTRDMYENAVYKGQGITSSAVKRNREDLEYKKRLIVSRTKSAKDLADKIRQGLNKKQNLAKLKQIDRDLGRLKSLKDRQEKALKRWSAIDGKFGNLSQQMAGKMASVETSILAFNQLREEFRDQKTAIDTMVVLSELSEISTTEFEGKVDDIMAIGDNLASATDSAFNNIFTDILDEGGNSSQRNEQLGDGKSTSRTDFENDESVISLLNKY